MIANEGFRASELRMMVCGSADIDVRELRRMACYKGCQMNDQMCRWLFDVLAGWHSNKTMFPATESQMEDFSKTPAPYYVNKFVEFATGSPRAPPGGYQNLKNKSGIKQPFTVEKLDAVADHMPRAHTCFNKVDFPPYSSREKLAEMLWLALVNGMNAGDL